MNKIMNQVTGIAKMVAYYNDPTNFRGKFNKNIMKMYFFLILMLNNSLIH